jgi:histidinol-phosphatase (PHP family)
MKLIDLHIHTRRSNHGTGDLIDFVQKAIELKYSIIGFNEHAPYLFDQEHRMSESDLDIYIKDALELKELYKNQIKILVGLEVDYHPNNHDYISNMVKDLPLDFCSGAIHFLSPNERNISVWDYELFDSSYYIDLYFDLLKSTVNSKLFSHIVHPDIILRSGIKFSKLIGRIEKLLIIMREAHVGYEINCSGIDKRTFDPRLGVKGSTYGSYPCLEFVNMAMEANVPLIIGSDAHSVELLGANIPQILEQLDSKSIHSIYSFIHGFL